MVKDIEELNTNTNVEGEMSLGTWSNIIEIFGNVVTAVYSFWKASHISRPNLFFYVKCIKSEEKTEWRLKVYNSEARKVFLYMTNCQTKCNGSSKNTSDGVS